MSEDRVHPEKIHVHIVDDLTNSLFGEFGRRMETQSHKHGAGEQVLTGTTTVSVPSFHSQRQHPELQRAFLRMQLRMQQDESMIGVLPADDDIHRQRQQRYRSDPDHRQ